jgi:hypothetical protein
MLHHTMLLHIMPCLLFSSSFCSDSTRRVSSPRLGNGQEAGMARSHAHILRRSSRGAEENKQKGAQGEGGRGRCVGAGQHVRRGEEQGMCGDIRRTRHFQRSAQSLHEQQATQISDDCSLLSFFRLVAEY